MINLPDQQPAAALPLERLKVRLRLRQRTFFHFQHGGVLHGLLCRAFGSHLPPGIFPLALESGRVAFQPGDFYDFVVSAAGSSRALLSVFEASLRSLTNAKRKPGAATLDGNFELVAVEKLAAPTLEESLARAEMLLEQESLRLIFHSPLRLRRPEELAQLGASYFNRDCFPARLLFDRLWRRYRQLVDGEFPSGEAIPMPPSAIARVEDLVWLDMPVRGRIEGKPGRPRGTTLGGVCGSVALSGVPVEWLRLLVLMEAGQLGSSTHFGFGGFFVGELPAWLRPARTYEEALGFRAGDPRAAAEALTPAALAILDEGASFFRSGLSRFSAAEGQRRARAAGMQDAVAGAGTRFIKDLDGRAVMARLEALWPGEPLVEKLGSRLELRGECAELAKLLGKVFASELVEAMQREGKRLVRIGDQLRVVGRVEALAA